MSMNKKYRLYVNAEHFHFETLEDAKKKAADYFPVKAELRIEYLFDCEGADFWAYEYPREEWVPS
ncbi:MAG: hypothetical protein HWE10_13405 [Gammaproteobacteria bacterium]|nr:hypothetical protein [Gammaproteobacteria bacterium]